MVSECFADGDANLRCTAFQDGSRADAHTTSDVGGVLQSPVGAAFGITCEHPRCSSVGRFVYTVLTLLCLVAVTRVA